MRWLYRNLPGPPAVRALLIGLIAVVVFVALVPLFDWAGDLLDSGGVIGGWRRP